MKRITVTLFLLLLFTNTILCQESEKAIKKKEPRNSWIMLHLNDQDVILTLSSIEWRIPDRWSITSRYIHGFDKERKKKKGRKCENKKYF
ncbi:MAG: hypothetical protein KAS53_06650 [Candidatus Cloacimonetes bacterium]|nr:hypothetical protein [Candidatus Cloacimonadota bacterium]